jgi:hypothetical protein
MAPSGLRRTLAGELTGGPELLVLDLSDIEPDEGRSPCLLESSGVDKKFQTFSSITEALQHPHDRSPQRLRRAVAKSGAGGPTPEAF